MYMYVHCPACPAGRREGAVSGRRGHSGAGPAGDPEAHRGADPSQDPRAVRLDRGDIHWRDHRPGTGVR